MHTTTKIEINGRVRSYALMAHAGWRTRVGPGRRRRPHTLREIGERERMERISEPLALGRLALQNRLVMRP